MANQTAFSNAQQSLRAARSALMPLAAALPAGADAASNLRGDLPIALFPVRIKSRFVRSAPTVRAGLGVRRATGATSLASISSGSVAAGPTTSAATVSRAPSTGSAVVRAGVASTVPAAAPVGILQIRVFPDELLAQTHEPESTDDEWSAGRAYWASGDTLASWAALLARFPAPRAAWIVSQTNTTVRPPLAPPVGRDRPTLSCRTISWRSRIEVER